LYKYDIAKIKTEIKKKACASFLSQGPFKVIEGIRITNQAAILADFINPKFRHAEAIKAGIKATRKQLNNIGSKGYGPKNK
jgi:hypothetical protein